MRHWLALKSVVVLSGLFAVSLVVVGFAVAQGAARFVVPSPDTTASQFVKALAAHRYEGARSQLSEELEHQVTSDQLKGLVRSIEDRHQGIEQVSRIDAQEQGRTATATVEVLLRDQTRRTLQFSLSKEHGMWKLDTLDPLRQLAE